MSVFPASTHAIEATFVPEKIDSLWRVISALDFRWWSLVKSSSLLHGASYRELDATIHVEFHDGQSWEVAVRELSSIHHSITFEIVNSEPAAAVSSAIHTISLSASTGREGTFIKWVSDFSSDATHAIVQDNSFKRQEAFVDIHRAALRACGAFPIDFGEYVITTCGNDAGAQPSGWGLAAWRYGFKDVRNDFSSYAGVHSLEDAKDRWVCNWILQEGKQPGTYRISTRGNVDAHQPEGWVLSAWRHGYRDVRNEVSSYVGVHCAKFDDQWCSDWTITPGREPGQFRISTCGNFAGAQPEGWALSAWRHGYHDVRSAFSSYAGVHRAEGDDRWCCDWTFQRV